MRLWLDDERPAPSADWVRVTTAADAIARLAAGGVVALSLDHDLGDDAAGSGYDVAAWVERAAFDGRLARLAWSIHSANPVGRARMTSALQAADRFWGA